MFRDCTAFYFPYLNVYPTPLNIFGSSLGVPQSTSLRVANGSPFGILNFTVSVTYQTGANWLKVTPTSGSTSSFVSVSADPGGLAPGIYNATITIDSGVYGQVQVPLTFNVGPVGVNISNIGSAASFTYGTVAPGSYIVIFGQNLYGNTVGLTFGAQPSNVIYKSADGKQLNVIASPNTPLGSAVPVVVTVDGKPSNTFNVAVVANAPGIFTPGIVNVDSSTINSAGQPAARGSFISVYLTGLTVPLTGQVTVNIGNMSNLVPSYAGAQPTLQALDQVNIRVPAGLTATGAVPLQICIPGPSGSAVCSNTVNLYVQ